jgi:hypothetical protein
MSSLIARALLSLTLGWICFSSVSHAAEAGLLCEKISSSDLQSKKKRLKTYTVEFWETIESKLPSFPMALQAQGVVVGDFHFGNLGIYFDKSADSPRLSINDLDDSGANFLIGDLLKYLVYLRSIDKKGLRLDDVISAYSEGLAGHLVSAPAGINEILHFRSYDFEKRQAKYLKKKEEDLRDFNPSELTPDQAKTLSLLGQLSFFKRFDLLGESVQVNDSGSSAGMDRYLFLVRSKTSETKGLIELKTLKCSATGDQDQQNLSATHGLVMNYILSLTGENPQGSLLGRQRVLRVQNQFFLYREKEHNFLEDLKIEDMDSSDLQKYAEFYASYLGFFHSKSAPPAYRQGVKENTEFLLEQLKPLMKDFKKRVGGEN